MSVLKHKINARSDAIDKQVIGINTKTGDGTMPIKARLK